MSAPALSMLDKARAGWDRRAPDWVEELALLADREGLRGAEKAIGYSRSTVSEVIGGVYRGDLARVEQKVRGALMGLSVECPVLGEIGRDRCLDHQLFRRSTSNSFRMRLYRACRSGCPHSRLLRSSSMKHAPLQHIITTVAEHYAVHPGEITGPGRSSQLIRARVMAAHQMRQRTLHSLTEIGRALGGRDHSTVGSAILKMRRLIARDTEIAAEAEAIALRLEGGPTPAPMQLPPPPTPGDAARDETAAIRAIKAAEAQRAMASALSQVVKAAWSFVAETDRLGEAGSCREAIAEVRTRQVAAFRRLRAALRMHAQKENSQC